jgi:hypothetical protein
VFIRANAPVFGASNTLPFQGKEWQINFNTRYLHSYSHYSGTQYQFQRKDLGTYVINNQAAVDLGVAYSFTPQLSAWFSVPYVDASWSIPLPTAGPTGTGPRSEQNGRGIGDVIFGARYWTVDPAIHRHGNFSVGLGVKAPTGKYDVTDEYPLFNGTNPSEKAVDQSVQPGDGGWGGLLDLQGYYAWNHVSFYASGTYLANPRNTNGTPSIVDGLGFGANPAFADINVNSVPDNYLLRAGTIFPFGGGKFAASAGFRMEGLPRYDFFGRSDGWRRPGYETFFEPGFVWMWGGNSLSLYVPLALVRNRRPNPYTGNEGDATFPDYIVLTGYSYRFPPKGGRPASAPRESAPTPPGTPPATPAAPPAAPSGGGGAPMEACAE